MNMNVNDEKFGIMSKELYIHCVLVIELKKHYYCS